MVRLLGTTSSWLCGASRQARDNLDVWVGQRPAMFGLLRWTLFTQMTSRALPLGEKRLTKSRTVVLHLGASWRVRVPVGQKAEEDGAAPQGLQGLEDGGEPSQLSACLFPGAQCSQCCVIATARGEAE